MGFKPSLALLYHKQRLTGFFRLAFSPKIFCFGDAVSDDFWTSSSKSSSFQLAMIFRLLVPKVLAFSDTANNVLGLH